MNRSADGTALVANAHRTKLRAQLILLAYLLPLCVTTICLAMLDRPKGEPGPSQAWTFVAYLAIGALIAAWRLAAGWAAARWSRTPARVPESCKANIVVYFPSLAALNFVNGSSGVDLSIDGRFLRIGHVWTELAGNLPAPEADELFFSLAHEVRHQAVGAFRVVMVFRIVKTTYLFAALAIYTAFLLNWTSLADDPDRLALIAYTSFFPALWGLLQTVLDEAMAAFEWRLELDADVAARACCRDAGRSGALDQLVAIAAGAGRKLRRHADTHPPPLLRTLALLGDLPSWRRVNLVLASGWVVAVAPLAMTLAFAAKDVADPDRLNFWLGVLSAILVAATTAALIAAGKPTGSTLHTGLATPVLRSAAMVVLRIHVIAINVVGVSVGCLALLCTVMMLWGLRRGQLPGLADLGGLALLVAGAAIYLHAGRTPLATLSLVLTAFADWIRLTVMCWFFSATGVLPFYNDAVALGAAIRDNPVVIAAEMDRIRQQEPWHMVAIISASGGFAWIAFALVLTARYIVQSRRSTAVLF